MRQFLFTLLLSTSLAGTAAAEIRIAAVGPMKGPLQSLGQQIRAGVEKAAADLNAAGGIDGEMLVVDVEDDGCTAEGAAAAANRAAGRADALVVGHVCAEAAGAAAPVYAEHGIVAITPAVTADRLTNAPEAGPIFRLAARDSEQGAAAAAFIVSKFGDRRIAILSDGSPYGKALADSVKAGLDAAGLRDIRFEAFEPGAKSYSTLAGRLEADAIEVVFIAGYAEEAAEIGKALRARGGAIVIMGGDALATGEYAEAAGDLADGTFLTSFADWRASPGAAKVVADFRAEGIEPQGYVLPAYAAVQVFAAARKAGADGVGARIASSDEPTILGPTGFDAKGDTRLPGFVIYEWMGGRLVPAGS